VAGRCIGSSDVKVDRRKAKRLAHRIRRRVRHKNGPRVVWTSPLQRAAEVGRWLARWGWQHHLDWRLSEIDFGDWEGRAWDAIGHDAVHAWTDDFAAHAPGGGESVSQLLARCSSFLAEHALTPVYVVGHAGWINAARRVTQGVQASLTASQWPAAVPYGAAVELWRSAGGAESQ
jgi:alpha-ribazole phosphatase